MAENNRNQQNQTSGNSSQQSQNENQDQNYNQNQQKIADEGGPNHNPQDGNKWNNYRSREYSEEGGGAGNASTPNGQ